MDSNKTTRIIALTARFVNQANEILNDIYIFNSLLYHLCYKLPEGY
jgi:hypothetical protein